MNDYKKIGRILFPYRYRLLSVSVVNLLSAFFSLCSVAILAPLLSLVFNQVKADMTPPSFSFTSDTLLAYAQYYLSVIITGHGALLALLILLCVVFVSFLFERFPDVVRQLCRSGFVDCRHRNGHRPVKQR